MAAITWSDVLAFAPELSGVVSGAQDDIIDYVEDAIVSGEFGGESSPTYRLARIYLAAHYGTVTVNGSNGAAGPVIGESAGGLSRQYAAFSPTGSDALLDVTPYGKAFRSLLRRSPARAPFLI